MFSKHVFSDNLVNILKTTTLNYFHNVELNEPLVKRHVCGVSIGLVVRLLQRSILEYIVF